MKAKKTPKIELDKRINASIISFNAYITVFLIIFILMVGQAIMLGLVNELTALVWVLIHYFLISGLIVAILFGAGKRYIFGKPIRRLAEAARQITKGNFDVKVNPLRKDGKKDEIDVLIEDFNKMAEELSSVETLKSDFIANVSHEIKSPLSIIQSYAMALKDKSITEAQRDIYADTVIDATQKLSVMVTNILKLNKLENQEIQPLPKRYQLGEQLRRCALSQIESWQENDIDFIVNVEDIIVNYDESLLDIVWNNLISNAVKFTQPGGNITISSISDKEHVFVTVKDTGCGMSAEVVERVFDKFYQGDASRSTQGNGLGLALVKKVLQIVECEITVESNPENGSAFTVKLKK